MSFHSVLVLTRGTWERHKPWACTLYWCSPGEPGNEDSHELTLLTGAHQESLGTKLAMSLQSVLVQTREPGNKASPGIVLRTGAHKGSLGTMLALGSYPPHWCSPGSQG